MIQFIQDTSGGYRHRTEENAKKADVTIAFACNFSTSGEKLTKSSALKYFKKYFAFPILDFDTSFIATYIINDMKLLNLKNISINVAGNSLTRFINKGFSQEDIDTIVYNTLKKINDEIGIKQIRSGGQSGADESGLKAAERLCIDSVCLCPYGYRFRDKNGNEVCDEKIFKERFEK